MYKENSSKVPFDLSYTTISGVVLPPLSSIIGVNIQIHQVVDCLIRYYFPKCKSIWDPTCGVENHQFKDYLVNKGGEWFYHGRIYYFATDVKRTKWNKMMIDLLKPPYPLRDNSFDIIVYDPPYVPLS